MFRLLGAAMSAAFPGFTMSWLPAELHRKLTEEMDFTVRAWLVCLLCCCSLMF